MDGIPYLWPKQAFRMNTYLKPVIRVLPFDLEKAFLNNSGAGTGLSPTIGEWEQDPFDYGGELG